jgi:hypothetical protein
MEQRIEIFGINKWIEVSLGRELISSRSRRESIEQIHTYGKVPHSTSGVAQM